MLQLYPVVSSVEYDKKDIEEDNFGAACTGFKYVLAVSNASKNKKFIVASLECYTLAIEQIGIFRQEMLELGEEICDMYISLYRVNHETKGFRCTCGVESGMYEVVLRVCLDSNGEVRFLN